MIKKLSTFISIVMLLSSVSFAQNMAYKDSSLPINKRVDDLLSRMTLEEKVDQITMNNNVLALKLDDSGEVTQESLDALFKGRSVGCIESPLVEYYNVAKYFEAIDRYMRENTRLGIPAIQTGECLHGFMSYGTTMFPQAVAQGATWNRELISKMAEAIAAEASLSGVDQALSPLFDLARDPRFGRVEECYGEDPYHVKEMGKSFVIGMQGDPETTKTALEEGKIGCTAKHFVAYSAASSGLNLAPANVGERELRDLHFYPFKGAIEEANIYSLMPGYHEIDGVPVHASSFLMRHILREEWGFKGYVISDAVAIHMMEFFHKTAKDRADAARIAITAGINLEMPNNYNYSTLVEQVKKGIVDEEIINEATELVLTTKFKMGLFDRPYTIPENIKSGTHTKENLAIAQQVAEESITLLKNNNNILPLDKKKIRSIAVIGPNANKVQLGDASVTRSIDSGISVLEGLQSYLSDDVKINYEEGCGITNLSKDNFAKAAHAARKSDVVVIVTGGTSVIYSALPLDDKDSQEPSTAGEGYDRNDLNFPGVQPELIDLICKQGKPVILLNISGRAYTMEREIAMVDAALQAWYPGEMGGDAAARILFGDVNPSGRLTVSFPRSIGHLPVVSNYKPSARGFYKSPGSRENPGRDYVNSTPSPLFPLGYGLSYTTFDYKDIKVENLLDDKAVVRVSFKVKNTGDREGAEVAQLYINDVVSSVSTPVVALKNFTKLFLAPSEEKNVTLDIKKEDLMLWNIDMKHRLEPGVFKVMVGASSEDIRLTSQFEVE